MSPSSALESFLAEPRNVIVAGVRRNGRPHLSPNWFLWDGETFYISTTRDRVKYQLFRNDPRVELVVDDATGHRSVLVSGMVEVREDVAAEAPHFRAVREKYGRATPPDDAQLVTDLLAEHRVMLAITPSGPPDTWTTWGLDD